LNTNVLNAIPNLKNWFLARRWTAFFVPAATRLKSNGSFPVSAAFPGAATAARVLCRPLPVVLRAVQAVAPVEATKKSLVSDYCYV